MSGFALGEAFWILFSFAVGVGSVAAAMVIVVARARRGYWGSDPHTEAQFSDLQRSLTETGAELRKVREEAARLTSRLDRSVEGVTERLERVGERLSEALETGRLEQRTGD